MSAIIHTAVQSVKGVRSRSTPVGPSVRRSVCLIVHCACVRRLSIPACLGTELAGHVTNYRRSVAGAANEPNKAEGERANERSTDGP